ncbi:hypothetical protein JTE90_022774 [Oedothorax gibbosus]|uniref:TEP1-F n=1 Tax=Oedothorax gibbosus TaxID=931172 RepID=A0AAV6UA87_9ARAC|nr:hypothetical protein JTE90_022774 [Oedothorax gibbosus]
MTTATKRKKDNGYIFTCPRSLKVASHNQLQFLRFGNLEEGTLKVRLYYKENYNGNQTLAAEKIYKLKQGKKVMLINYFVDPFPTDNVYSGRVQINGTIGGRKFGGSDEVVFQAKSNQNIIIIQTDKPLYRPGETMKIRVLKVGPNLYPSLNKKDVGEIFIEDPNGIRLFQKEGVPLKKGLYQTQFLLADEPVLGTWKVTLKTKNETTFTTFNVKKYVLPKFEVKIKPPPFILANAETIRIEVCANYTYGKPVQGQLNMTVSLQQYYYYRSSSKSPVLEEYVELNGCYVYNLNVSLIQTSTSDYYNSIMVFASVVEDGTGVEGNVTQYLSRTTNPLNLNFNADQQQRQYFKPGMPYNGKLTVTNPDNTPAKKERIELTYTVVRQRVIADYLGTKQVKYSKNFTTNAKGIIKYTIPPQNVDTQSITLEARSIKYAYDPNKPNQVLNQPQASAYLSPFYSPSGSFIQLTNVGQKVPCGSTANFKLLFTSKDNDDFKFFYEVVRQGKVVESGTKKVYFSTEDDVSKRYRCSKSVIDAKEEIIVPPPQPESESYSDSQDDCPAAVESRYTPPIGEVNLSFEIDSSYSPSFHLLVFYVRGDGETVADSAVFEVEKCFRNKVEFDFSDAVKQPGQTTQVTVVASPNSLCGIKTIDKSVTLLDNSDQLTAEKVFQLIQSMDTGIYYETDPCNSNSPQPGLLKRSTIIRPPPPGSYSNFKDSYNSFQNAGFLIISDLFVITRPCITSNGGLDPIRPIPIFRKGRPQILRKASAAKSVARAPVARLQADEEVGISTQSAVDVRQNFSETWLFELEMVGPDGVITREETLPDTITQWLGNAVCVSPEDGFGISNTTSITGFQLFFISYTLPISVIRGEEFTIVVSIFSYADGLLPVTVSVDEPEGYEIIGDSINSEECIKPGGSESYDLKLKATSLGKLNITVRAETSQSTQACGDSEVSDSYARDAITQPLNVEPEGFPVENVQGILFCPQDEKNGKFQETYNLDLPDDVVEGSERAYIDVTGNILGNSIANLDSLVSMPTGCGEQNLVKFVPNYVTLDYLTAIGELTDSVKNRAIGNLNTGYQRELNYRHPDGSFSAFGPTDKSGSMFLTAFVAKSFVQAKKYITIDDSVITKAHQWIASNQQDNGCFPNIGKIIDVGIQGGLEKDKSPAAITAYVLASLLISKHDNKTVINLAIECLKANEPKTPYETFLVAYAYALAGKEDDANQLLDDIKPFARSKDGVVSYSNPNGTKSLDVETNSYCVLTYLSLEHSPQDVLQIVRYLTKNLRASGGFYSTQDTCVGLTALSDFAKLVYGDPIDIEVSIAGGLDKTLKIEDENKLLVQRSKVSQVPSELSVVATGSGCGLIQTTLRYNSKTPSEKYKFYLKIVGECDEENPKKKKIVGIVSYLPPEQAAGFSLVQVKMQTGVVPLSDSINQLPGNPKYNILRADVEGNNVNLYFNEIDNKDNYFEFYPGS